MSWTEAGIDDRQLKPGPLGRGRRRRLWLLDNESPMTIALVVHIGSRRRRHIVVVCLARPSWFDGKPRDTIFRYQ